MLNILPSMYVFFLIIANVSFAMDQEEVHEEQILILEDAQTAILAIENDNEDILKRIFFFTGNLRSKDLETKKQEEFRVIIDTCVRSLNQVVNASVLKLVNKKFYKIFYEMRDSGEFICLKANPITAPIDQTKVKKIYKIISHTTIATSALLQIAAFGLSIAYQKSETNLAFSKVATGINSLTVLSSLVSAVSACMGQKILNTPLVSFYLVTIIGNILTCGLLIASQTENNDSAEYFSGITPIIVTSSMVVLPWFFACFEKDSRNRFGD